MMKKNEIVAEMVRVLTLEGQTLLQCAGRMANPEVSTQLIRALDYFQRSLDQGGKMIITGVGKSGKIGQKIAATLSSTGSLAIFLHPTEGLHGDLGVIRPQDSVLALSHTGNTDELLRLIPSIKKMGVPVVGLGGNPSSRLATECDAWIDAFVENEACPHNLAPTSSTTLALALGDAIALTLMQVRGFDAQSFAQIHPGGALGKRLNLRVADLMHQREQVPTLGPQASMEEVVLVSTQKGLGAVLVVEQGKLLGIITDGDLRRFLKYREKFFEFNAEQVMTRNPVTASPEMMAIAALQLMENRPSQISVLPVVDEDGNWIGLLRLHDLVRTL